MELLIVEGAIEPDAVEYLDPALRQAAKRRVVIDALLSFGLIVLRGPAARGEGCLEGEEYQHLAHRMVAGSASLDVACLSRLDRDRCRAPARGEFTPSGRVCAVLAEAGKECRDRKCAFDGKGLEDLSVGMTFGKSAEFSIDLVQLPGQLSDCACEVADLEAQARFLARWNMQWRLSAKCL